MKKLLIILIAFLSSYPLSSQVEFKKNSIVLETNVIVFTSISYDRYLPINDNIHGLAGIGYFMGTGFGYGSHWIIPEAGMNFFGPSHNIEVNLLYAVEVDPSEEYGAENSFGVSFAYRFLRKNGITFRASANVFFSIDPYFMPSMGIGYSF